MKLFPKNVSQNNVYIYSVNPRLTVWHCNSSGVFVCIVDVCVIVEKLERFVIVLIPLLPRQCSSNLVNPLPHNTAF